MGEDNGEEVRLIIQQVAAVAKMEGNFVLLPEQLAALGGGNNSKSLTKNSLRLIAMLLLLHKKFVCNAHVSDYIYLFSVSHL